MPSPAIISGKRYNADENSEPNRVSFIRSLDCLAIADSFWRSTMSVPDSMINASPNRNIVIREIVLLTIITIRLTSDSSLYNAHKSSPKSRMTLIQPFKKPYVDGLSQMLIHHSGFNPRYENHTFRCYLNMGIVV